VPMARAGPGTLLYRRNIRLDSFLKRNTERALYERIRGYEPCVVKSDSINKVYMHVVMSDERVYLTEFSPRTLTSVFGFRSVRAIELINDLPDFLSGKDREQCQHIKIIYVPEKPVTKGHHDDQLSPMSAYTPRPTRSASCPNEETLGLLAPPTSSPTALLSLYVPSHCQSMHKKNTISKGILIMRISLLFSRLLKQNKGANIAELHLYALSPISTLYIHLQSTWTSFIIVIKLYKIDFKFSNITVHCSLFSWEQTAHLFSQLQGEMLQEGISVESLYLLLQELCTAAHRNVTLRRLFWRSNELCRFLVQILEDFLPGDRSVLYTTDHLLMSILVVQTLAVMFRETEVEPARLSLLSANNGALVTRMLLALIRDPGPQTSNASQFLFFSQTDVCLAEYLDAACSLLFELLLQGQQKSKFSFSDSILSVGWILQVLQPHPHLLSFIGYQTQQVVLVLSSPPLYILSPVQSVLLFQRCRLLLVSLQYSKHLAGHLKTNFKDDFK
ncbi:hypothetical protein NQD34_016995, partial [Periophthalmus magnuspinnatus]